MFGKNRKKNFLWVCKMSDKCKNKGTLLIAAPFAQLVAIEIE
jgi:hypothetical protein